LSPEVSAQWRLWNGNRGQVTTSWQGHDGLIIEGKASSPVYIHIDDDRVEILPADEIWGKGTYETNDWIYKKYGKGAGA
jgi:aldehyde:ferredoxin oxidoreductase